MFPKGADALRLRDHTINIKGGRKRLIDAVRMKCKQDDLHVRQFQLKSRCRLCARQTWQGQIQQNQIGLEFLRSFEGFRTVLGFSANVKGGVALNKRVQQMADARVVIDYEDARHSWVRLTTAPHP